MDNVKWQVIEQAGMCDELQVGEFDSYKQALEFIESEYTIEEREERLISLEIIELNTKK